MRRLAVDFLTILAKRGERGGTGTGFTGSDLFTGLVGPAGDIGPLYPAAYLDMIQTILSLVLPFWATLSAFLDAENVLTLSNFFMLKQ